VDTPGAMKSHTLATSDTSRLAVHAKLVGMAALWGASWPAGRVLAQALPPMTAASWRFGIAVLLLLAWLKASGGLAPGFWRRFSTRQWLGLALAGAVGVFGYAVFFMLGLAQVPASRAALVVTTNPVFTMLIAAWLFGERLNARIVLGMALALCGAVWVITRGAPWLLFTGGVGAGEWLLMGCVATWVGYTLIGRKLLGGIDALTTTTATAACGLVLLLVVALALEGPGAQGLASPLHASADVLWALGFLAAGATVLAYAWYFEGVAALGAGGASAYISLVPVFGVLLSALWLGEKIDASLLGGGALAVGGMVLMNHARASRRP
jgi:drug/metabolite transporter (DMT)-like permease